MRIEDILKKQGELYKKLPINKIVEECNETIEKPQRLVPYKNYELLEKECKAIKELENLLGKEPAILKVFQEYKDFEIFIHDNKVTYLRIARQDIGYMPEQINNLTNLYLLSLPANQIKEIKNLDNLQNLHILWIHNNKIKEIRCLDKLQKLEELYLPNNKIKEIKNLDNLQNLKKIWLHNNKIKEIKNLDNLQNLVEVSFLGNPIKNKEEVEKLRDKGIHVQI